MYFNEKSQKNLRKKESSISISKRLTIIQLLNTIKI